MNREDLVRGGVKAAFDQKGAELEADNVINIFGADSLATRSIAAGVSKFAQGAMAAIEEKYRPATDGSRPANVSADQFKQDPTVGKPQIERFNDVYKYYDAEIAQERGRGDRYAICYTLSKTPPNAEVESIEEW